MEVAMETGTLKELGAVVGDVVEYTPTMKRTAITRIDGDDYYGSGTNPDMPYNTGPWFRIISRATQPTPDLTAITTPFGLLDEATQGALRAHGGPYEYWYSGEWIEGCNVGNLECWAWRVQPEPETETITCDAHIHPSGIISKIESDKPQPVRVTFNRINGVIDLASYKVEAR